MHMMRPPPAEIWRAWLARALLVAGALAVAAQFVVSMDSFLLPWARRVAAVADQPAWERSLRLASWIGDEEKEFLVFVHEVVPGDATLVLPEEPMWPFHLRENLGFYLFPRNLVSCPAGQVIGCVPGGKTSALYILSLPRFPQDGDLAATHTLIAFNDRFGVWAPR